MAVEPTDKTGSCAIVEGIEHGSKTIEEFSSLAGTADICVFRHNRTAPQDTLVAALRFSAQPGLSSELIPTRASIAQCRLFGARRRRRRKAASIRHVYLSSSALPRP